MDFRIAKLLRAGFVFAALCGLWSAAAAETLFRLDPADANARIPRPLRRSVRFKPVERAEALEVTSRQAAVSCSLNVPLELKIRSGVTIAFEYRVEAPPEFAPLYVGVAFEDAAGKRFFAKKTAKDKWTGVTLTPDKLVSTAQEAFAEGDRIRVFRIYTRNASPAPAGAVKLQVRNFAAAFDAEQAGKPDRVSYSAFPLFDWPRPPDAERYLLEYSDAPDFPADRTCKLETTVNFALPAEELKPGIWYYRATGLPRRKLLRRGSVLIPERRHTYRIAPYDFAAFGTAPHPRLKKLAEFNALHEPTLLADARRDLNFVLPPDVPVFRPGADPAVPTRIDWSRLYGRRNGNTGKTMARIGQAALITGDRELIAKARELALGVARTYDPAKATHRRAGDLPAINLLMGLGFCYDAAYDSMSGEERRDVDAALMTRGRQFWDFINPFGGNEAQNHSWDNTQAFAFAAVAADADPKERAVWFDFALHLFACRFLPSLGFDGENNEGLAYWRFGFNLIVRYLDLLRQTSGINLYALDYVRKTAAFGLYSAPLAGYEISFGDNGTPNHHCIWSYSRPFCAKLAAETGYPEILWYAMVPRSGKLTAKAPLAMPQSVTYPHIGVSLFNTFLPDARENVALGFHSGKYFAGHQHADQNSFSINAYGDKLIVDGGYYDWWGSPHHRAYSSTTLAHNTLLVDGCGQAERTPGADGVTTAFADSPSFGYVAGDAGNPKIYGGKLSRFEREIFFVKPDAVVTLDRVDPAREGAVCQYLLHAHGDRPTAGADGSFVIRRQFARLDGRMLTPARLSVTPAFETPPNDMVSSSPLPFYEKEWILRADFRAKEFLAAMEISRAGQPPKMRFARLESADALGVGADGLIAAFRRSGSGRFELSGLVSDGRAAAVRFDRQGQIIGAMLVGGTMLDFRGKALCRLPARGNWSFPAGRRVTVARRDDLLTLDGKPIPAECWTVVGGDGAARHLLSARARLPHDGLLATAPDGVEYIFGARTHFIGRAPRTHYVSGGDYLFSFTGPDSRVKPVRLTLTPIKPTEAVALPRDFRPPADALRLEAEAPSSYEGEELYIIGREFASGGKFGFRFQHPGQLLRWRFPVKQPGRCRVLFRVASTGEAICEFVRPDGGTVPVRFPATGGEGRGETDWRWFELPGGVELPGGEPTLELRHNLGGIALDALALIPEKTYP